jgi:hypothetical protein
MNLLSIGLTARLGWGPDRNKPPAGNSHRLLSKEKGIVKARSKINRRIKEKTTACILGT